MSNLVNEITAIVRALRNGRVPDVAAKELDSIATRLLVTLKDVADKLATPGGLLEHGEAIKSLETAGGFKANPVATEPESAEDDDEPIAEPEPDPVKIEAGYWYRTPLGNPVLSIDGSDWFLDYSTSSSVGRPFEYATSKPVTPWYAHEPLPTDKRIPEWIKNAAKFHPTPPVKVEVGGVYASKTSKQYRCVYEAKGMQTYPYVCISRDGIVLKTASNSAIKHGTELRFVRRVPESEIEAGL